MYGKKETLILPPQGGGKIEKDGFPFSWE